MKKIHRCKLHRYTHEYTVCPECGCQYCDTHWAQCPRTSWHPNHGQSAADTGRRYNQLEQARSTTK